MDEKSLYPNYNSNYDSIKEEEKSIKKADRIGIFVILPIGTILGLIYVLYYLPHHMLHP